MQSSFSDYQQIFPKFPNPPEINNNTLHNNSKAFHNNTTIYPRDSSQVEPQHYNEIKDSPFSMSNLLKPCPKFSPYGIKKNAVNLNDGKNVNIVIRNPQYVPIKPYTDLDKKYCAAKAASSSSKIKCK